MVFDESTENGGSQKSDVEITYNKVHTFIEVNKALGNSVVELNALKEKFQSQKQDLLKGSQDLQQLVKSLNSS